MVRASRQWTYYRQAKENHQLFIIVPVSHPPRTVTTARECAWQPGFISGWRLPSRGTIDIGNEWRWVSSFQFTTMWWTRPTRLLLSFTSSQHIMGVHHLWLGLKRLHPITSYHSERRRFSSSTRLWPAPGAVPTTLTLLVHIRRKLVSILYDVSDFRQLWWFPLSENFPESHTPRTSSCGVSDSRHSIFWSPD